MLINRYLIKNLLNVTLSTALVLTAVVWLTQSLKLLELLVNSDAPVPHFLKLVALSMPRFLVVVLPLSLVAACLFVYHRMILDNEVIILRANGFDNAKIAAPALRLSAAVMIVMLALTTYLAPAATSQMQDLRQLIKTQYSSLLLREGTFNTLGKDITVYFRKRTRDGFLLGLMIHDTREQDRPPVTVTAKKGRLIPDPDSPRVIVYDGLREQLDPSAGAMTRLHFDEYALSITDFAEPEKARWKEPEERTFDDLLAKNYGLRHTKIAAAAFAAEIHRRLTAPLYAPAMALAALALLLCGPFERRGHSRRVWMAVGAIVLLQTGQLAVAGLMKKSVLAIPLAYLLPLGAGYAGMLALSGRLERLRRRARPAAGAGAA